MNSLLYAAAAVIFPFFLITGISIARDAKKKLQMRKDYRRGQNSACRDISLGLMSERNIRSEAWHRGYDDELWSFSSGSRKAN